MRIIVSLVALLALAPLRGEAAPVVLGTDTLLLGGMPIAENTQALAQPFTLTSSVSVTAIDVFLIGGTLITDPLLVQLTNSLGPGTTNSNVLLNTSLAPSGVPTSPPGAIVSFPVSITLTPGSYYIVLSTTDIWGYDWAEALNMPPSAVGTVGQAMSCCFPNTVGSIPAAETFKVAKSGPADKFYFGLEGVPEPSSAALFAFGILLVAARRKS